MSTTLVTICIPIYNASLYLEDAIKSVINQTMQNWQLYLINDGSTDKSLEIIEKFLDDKRITLINDGINKGLIYRLNQSVRLVKTKYYVRMDADDIMHPKRLEIQLSIMERNPSFDVLGSNAYSINSRNEIMGVRRPISQELDSCKSFIHPSIICKTSWLEENHYLDLAERVEDKELWFRTQKHSVFKCINIPLLFYREFDLLYYPKYKNSIIPQYKMYMHYKNNREYDSTYWLKSLFFTILKFFAYKVFYLLKNENDLIKRRCIVLTSTDLKNAQEQLNRATKNS